MAKKKILSLILIASLVTLMGTSAFAKDDNVAILQEDDYFLESSVQQFEVGETNMEQYDATGYHKDVCEEIVSALTSYYDGVYKFENWDFRFDNEMISDISFEADVYVAADMILTRSYEQNPYYQGLVSVYNELDGNYPYSTMDLEAVISEYKSIIQKYYYEPYRTGFVYHVKVMLTQDNPLIYLYRGVNLGEEGYLWESVNEFDKFNDLASFENGTETAQMVAEHPTENIMNNVLASSNYNASSAVSYATLHATDDPEFDKTMGQSDCANFVSKCINAGGIATDKNGNWYPATTWGNYNTAGTNWIRTGYYNNGGVIPYFQGKNYISAVTTSSVSTGCIMSWNKTSHVAIVTYFDGSTIKYSEHSSVKRDSQYYTYTTEDVNFYKFN